MVVMLALEGEAGERDTGEGEQRDCDKALSRYWVTSQKPRGAEAHSLQG